MSVITSGMPLTLVVHRVSGVSIATLPAWQPIMFLLLVRYSGCSLQRALRTHSFPSSLTASLTAGALLLSHMVRSRREKQKL